MPASFLEVADTPAPLLPAASSASMREVLQAAGDVAASPTTVLLLGESGTGKEVLARILHDRSQRPGPWVAVNCAALPAELLESELFGYERGAFTGASERRAGRFEQAQHGTILLDEVSELPLPLQAKLLRVLQEREVDRIGGQRPIPVDVRVVATSNRDLGEMVRRGLFRSDLYYRLNVFPITLPPLRSRREDLPALASQLLTELAAELGRSAPRIDEAALGPLLTHPFPGNVRELRNVLERALVRCRGAVLSAQDLALDGMDSPSALSVATPEVERSRRAATFGASGLPIDLSELEKLAIAEALRRVGGNRTHAARLLGIGLRTLRNKLRLYREAGVPMESAGTADGQVPPTTAGDDAPVSQSACRACPSQEERS